jgi:hypothetical protein
MPKTTSLDLRDLAEPFNVWCARRRISRSFAIRQLVASAIGNDPQLSCLAPTDLTALAGEWDGLGSTDADPAFRFTLRLTMSQRNHLRVRAAAAGISCSRYILAAITARESDAGPIAGQDAVQALNRSNHLLAQAALRFEAWRYNGGTDRVAPSGNRSDRVSEFLNVLRDHLAHAATVVSAVELTRVGRAPRRKADSGREHAQPGGLRKRPRTLG